MTNPYDQFAFVPEKNKADENPYNQFDQPKESEYADMSGGEMVLEGVKNIPGSLYDVGEGIFNAVTNPIDTAKGAYELGKSGLAKGQRNIQELAAGVEIPEGDDEETANYVMQALDERYGSLEALRDTAIRDPAGLALDLSGMGLGKLGKLEPLGAVGRLGQKGLGKSKAAERLYGTNMDKKMMPDEVSELSRAGLDEGIPFNRKGRVKGQAVTESLNEDLNRIINTATDEVRMIPTSVVTKHFDDLMRSREGMFEGDFDIAKLNKMKDDFANQYGNKVQMTPEELHRFKTDIYTKAYKRGADPSADVSGGIKTEGMREMGRGSKEALASRYDDYGPTNKKWSQMERLDRQIQAKLTSQGELSPGLMAMINKVVNNPSMKSRVAIGLDRVASGDMGWLEKNLNSAEIRTVLALSGRNQEFVEEQEY